jgi:hypothetical protein
MLDWGSVPAVCEDVLLLVEVVPVEVVPVDVVEPVDDEVGVFCSTPRTISDPPPRTRPCSVVVEVAAAGVVDATIVGEVAELKESINITVIVQSEFTT